MESNYKIITVFVSYPSDVEVLIEKVFDACYKFNYQHSEKTKYFLKPIDCKTGGPQEAGPRAQSLINELINKSDIFIGILWKRFGSPTGAISKSTGIEYESGMREEFELALDKKKEQSNFKIAYFFKRIEKIDLDSVIESEQVTKVLQFKEELKNKKIFINQLDNKSEIGLEIYRYLEEKIDEFKSEIQEIEKIKLANPIEKVEITEDYLSRTVLLHSGAISTESSFLRYEASKDIAEVLDKENRIVLLADAGSGKTTELQRIFSVYSKKDSGYYPVLVPLNLYTNERIEELLPDYWREIPEKSLLLLLDGFDEIKSDNKITAVREIEKFSEKYKNCKVVITCRTNFYNSANNTYSGTLKSFSVYVLNALERDEYDKYVTRKLNKKRELFYEAVQKNRSAELLDIPFYLKFLVNKYLTDDKLPSSRNEIFDELIKSRIQFDDEHFRTVSNEDIIENKEIVFRSFERLALVMETLCRNYISNKEYLSIIPDARIRSILKQKGIWNSRNDKWQFEHNSFQEYLAAKVLSTVSVSHIKKFLAFPPRFNIIIPSWVNTLSFLLNVFKDNKLKNWILSVQPELTIKFEPDRVNNSLKKKIFIRIFNNYKKKKIWIDRDKYNLYELAKFGECEETINFLLRHINVKEYYTVIGNAIILLTHMEIPIENKDKIRAALLNAALVYNNKYIKNDAMIALGALDLNTQEVIEGLFEVYGKSDDDWIRYGMYFLIEQSNYLNEYIDYFLDGIKFYSDRFSSGEKDARIGNEFWHLENGLQKVNRTESALKILDYLLANPSVVHIIGFDRVIPQLMVNFAPIYLKEKDESLFNKICSLYLILNKHYFKNEAKYCLLFFDKSNTRVKAFYSIYNQKSGLDPYDVFECLASLSNQDCTEIITQGYSTGKINEQEIWYYQQNLVGELNTYFNKKINVISNNKFILKPLRDFTKENEAKLTKDVSFLFNKEAFIAEIYSIFKNKNVKVLKKDLVDEIRYKSYDETIFYSNSVLRKLDDILEDSDKTFEEIKEIIEKVDWEYYSVKEIYNYLVNSRDIVLDVEKLNRLKTWCQTKLSEVDFKTALKQEGTTTTTSTLSVMLHYFLRKYKFAYPKDKLLDMISFDWYEVGIDYLEEFLTTEEMTKRILTNLKTKENNDYQLRNYFRFCIKHKIMASKESAIKEILNMNREKDIRKLALELLVKLVKDNRTLLSLLGKIQDSFKWELVELLVDKNNQKVRDYLLQAIRDNSNDEQMIASNYLMRLQDLRGLKFYTETLEKEKKFVHNWHKQRAISYIKSPKALKYLFRLLSLSYDKDLQEDKFDTLYRVVENVLTNIALMNESNYKKVHNSMINFIKTNQTKHKEINFLYSYLDRLERQFYFSKSQNVSLKEAISKLKLVGL